MCNIICAVLILLMLPHLVGCLDNSSNCVLQFPQSEHYYMDGDFIIGGIITVMTSMTTMVLQFDKQPDEFLNIRCRLINIWNYQNLAAFVFAISEINNNPKLLPGVTLGFHLVDSCLTEKKAITGMLDILSGTKVPTPIPNYSCKLSSQLIGFVDGISSKVSLLLARMFSMYNYPQISYSSLDPVLSDKVQFPTFFRTVPNELSQFQAIVKLIKHFGWSWVGILVSDNESGLKASQVLQRELTQNVSCIAFVEFIPYHDAVDYTSRDKIVKSLRSSSANVIILYGDRHYMLSLQIILYMFPISEKVWIISSRWDVSAGSDYNFLSFEPFNGSLAFTLHSKPIPNFKDFFLNISSTHDPNDIFLPYAWIDLFSCNVRGKIGDPFLCTGQEKLEDSKYPNIHTDVSSYSYSIYNAVHAFGHALDKMISQNNNQTDISKLHEFLRDVSFTNSAGDNVDFDENGDTYSEYDILNWIVFPNNMLNAIKVGRFHQKAGQSLIINESLIRWNPSFNQTPRSTCSEICQPGYRKSARQSQSSCCYDCVPCPDGQITNQTDMDACLRCPKHEWSNANKDTCISKVVTYLSYDEQLGISLALISIFMFLSTCVVNMIFIKYRNTPVVKANNRDISFILLISLKMCFLCTLIFIGHPQKITCILRQTVFGITFSISVSSVLAKTVTVVIAFNATKPGSMLRNWMGFTLPNSIVIFCTFIQVMICAVWLGTSPPFPYYNMEDEVDKIAAQCNEGSAVGFYCVLGYMGFLASLSFVIAFLARKLPDIFNEAKFITFSMLVFCSVWIAFIPAYLSTKGKNMVTVEIFAILASTSGLLGCIFIPKCYIILIRPDMNTKTILIKKRDLQ